MYVSTLQITRVYKVARLRARGRFSSSPKIDDQLLEHILSKEHNFKFNSSKLNLHPI